MKFADFQALFLYIMYNACVRRIFPVPSTYIYINKMMKTLEKFSVRYTLFIIV